MEELPVGTSSTSIDNSGFQVEENTYGDVLASTSLGEEGVESIIATSNSLIRGHLSVRLNSVFETEEFPAGVTYLDTGLTNVD